MRLQVLNTLLQQCRSDDAFPHRKALFNIFDIHGETFLAVAFDSTFDTEEWREGRSSARTLVSSMLEMDCDNVLSTIMRLTQLLALVERPGGITKGRIKPLSIRMSTWKKLYSVVQTNDPDGIATLLSLAARSAHVDLLIPKHFSATFSLPPQDDFQGPEEALNEANRSLTIFKDGFLTAINRYADFNVSTAALDLMSRPSVVRNVIKLLMSPAEEYQDAAQVLVGLAFDVDGRHECLRAIMENVPSEAFDGILEYLATFVEYAPLMPEACSLSKSLVRCFTDVIDVLCASPNGLLHSPEFLRPGDDKGPAAKLLKLWKLMTKSLTVIFKRTPVWAPYFDNEEMVVWMRDALIFGRDLLATWRIIENAANSRVPEAARNRGELTSIGKKMINGLQEILPELTRWLRLTDEELLHQSFSLLTSLLACFKDAGMTPIDNALARLRKSIQNARRMATEPSQLRSRLDSTMLLTLEAAIDDFEDVVEIIPTTDVVKERESSKSKTVTAKPKEGSRAKVQSALPLKPKPKVAQNIPPRPSSSSSRYFTEADQQKIDSDLALPAFRKPGRASVSVKPSAVVSSSRFNRAGPKFEGQVSGNAQSSSSSDDSSSEGEHEEEGPTGGLANLAKLQISPKIRKPHQRRQIMTMDIPTQKNPMQERLKRREETRNAAYRLNPDISGLHAAVLAWNYEHTGSHPPGDKLELLQVPDTFAHHAEYKKVWEPLLLLDLWAQIQQAKEETSEVLECKVTGRQFSDQWIDLDVSFTGSIKKDWYLSDTDLIVLRHLGTKKCILAKAMSFKSIPHGPQQGTQAGLRCFAKNDPGLQMNTTWILSKVLKSVLRLYFGNR